MKKFLSFITALFVITLVLTNSCTKDKAPIYPINKLPVASAGIDQMVLLPKDSVLLDGTNSNDPDGRIVSYVWTKIAGPTSFFIANDHAARTMVYSLQSGLYQFQLLVTDDNGGIGKDTIQITVSNSNGVNHAPVAYAGDDISLTLPLNSCALNGNGSYDPDGSIVTYEWRNISGPSGYVLNNAGSSIASLSNLVEGIYQFELKVTDNGGLTAKDSVQVIVHPVSAGACDISGRPVIAASLTQVGNLSVARTPAVGAAANKIVFAGGIYNSANKSLVTDDVDIYDLSTKTWTTAHLSKPRGDLSAISAGNKIYFAGGTYLSSTVDSAYTEVDIYDAVNNTWSLEHLSKPRGSIAAAAVGNKILFAGGTPNWWQASSRVDIYDVVTKQWTTAELSQPRMYIGAVTVGDKVYFAGGETFMEIYNMVDVYDNTTNKWSVTSLNSIIGPASGVVYGNTIYWAGTLWSGSATTTKVEMWNMTNNTVSTDCLSFTRGTPMALVRGNDVAFFGWFFGLGATTKFDIYNTQTQKWSIGSINPPIETSAIISYNNKIYMAGGLSSATTNSDKVYELNW